METSSVETDIQKPLKGLPPISFPTRVSEKFKEKLRALKDIQGQTTLLIKSSSLPKLPNDKNNSTNYFDDNSRKLGTENNFNMRSASFNGSHLSTNYADTYFSPETRLMINELEKHGEELAKAQDQINMFLPRDVINKLKKDKSSLNKQKIAEEDEEFESDATSDYSDDEEEDVQGKVLTKESDSMLLNDQNKIVDDDPEKAWKDFDWNSNIDVTTMKSQSLRNSYRASGSFIRNSYHTTFKNASLQQLSRSNCKNINIQQWKKEHQVNYNSRKIYNSSIGNKSDSSISGTNGILIKQVNHVRKDYFEPGIEEFKQPSDKIKSSLDNNLVQESGEHASSSSREGSVDSLLTGDALPDKMLTRIVKLEFEPRSPNSKAKTSIKLTIHSVTHHTKPNSSYHELLKKLFLFPFDYHSFVFDTLKIDIYEHANFSYAKKRLGRAFIRLINLKESIINRKDFEGTFPLELNVNGHKIGSIQIAIKFHFPSDPPLLTPKTPKPVRSKTVPSFFPNINAEKSRQIMPPSVTNIKRNVDEEVSTEISDVEDGEFAITYPENKPLGILDMVLGQETRDAIKEITVLYHAFFDNGWRLSKLEFLKAYMLLEKYYVQKPNPVTGILCHDLERIQTAQKYLKYSMASYGSFLFNWFGYGHSKAHLNAIRINSDRKAVQEFFSLENEDIICWEYGQKAVSVPNYMVIHDPETKSIIISIRGTMNVTDVITDALAHHEPWNGGFVHRGVLRSAKYLVKHSLKNIREAVKKFESKAIQVIGHSLGASVSSIVTLLLREQCRDLITQGIDIHAWNFATAPCCSLDLACKAETENCIDNFVNENDVIPRLSYGNLMDFKELVKFAASELKNEKYKKLSSKDKLSKILTSIDDYRTCLKSNSATQKLYIPGTIYYLYKGFYRTHVNSSVAYYTKDIVCEKSKPDLFTDISLRRNWLFHHFPDRYDKKFKGVTKSIFRKLHGKDRDGRISDKLIKKWKKIPETEIVIEEAGKMGKLMPRTGHI